jgi:predicted phosphodiesterase
MRVFALSDIHVDYAENMTWIEQLSRSDYRNDALILAGDVTHQLRRLEQALVTLRERFAMLLYVPGNHELWCRNDGYQNSVNKFHDIIELCAALDVATQPRYIAGTSGVWLVPLFSWYTRPEQGADSLFVAKPGEDPSLAAWSDNYFVRWPDAAVAADPAAYFLALNRTVLARTYAAPVISFSHFLPRRDLIFSRSEELAGGRPPDRHPGFNFSRVAGTGRLDRQLRQLRSVMHVYGHQHRNRYRLSDDVLYVSCCLGYSVERNNGSIRFVDQLPRLIWDSETATGNPDIKPSAVPDFT